MPREFDVFLSHNSQDGPAVEQIARQLEAHGIRPWLTKWDLRPGENWQQEIEDQLLNIGAIAIFIGPDGIGPWQQAEIDTALIQRVERGCPIIPVILPSVGETWDLPVSLRKLGQVDFRRDEPDPVNQLVWGITGVQPNDYEVRLSRISVSGFKTISDVQSFEPRAVAVLIGPNGAGKSNFISFFHFLSRVLETSLQQYVGECGGASALFHGGLSQTEAISAVLAFESKHSEYGYELRLIHAAGDSLTFAEERCRVSRKHIPSEKGWVDFGVGHREAGLVESARKGDRTAQLIRRLMRKLIVYQFNDTSPRSRIRQKWNENDGRWLKGDGGNLASFLYRLQSYEPKYYQRIVDTLRLILPFFSDFELEPEHGRLLLRWREQGSDAVYDASQAADGMLRVMALVALLLQPKNDLPSVLILDEPELGLHPYAINVLGGLIQSVSTQVQVILATQSIALLDCFEPDDVVVVDRRGRESTFTRLNASELEGWLEEYSLSELWEKNVLGGRPAG